MRPKLPTASSLAVAAAAAAAVAAAAAEQASRKLLEDALPKAASTASLPAVARPESSHEPQPPAEDPAMTEPSSGAAPSSGAPATALEPPSAVTVPDAMDTDAAPVAQAPDSEAEPERDEPDKAEEAEQTPALDKQAAVQLPVSDLDRSDLNSVDLHGLCLVLVHDQLMLLCYEHGKFPSPLPPGHTAVPHDSNRCLHYIATLVIMHRYLVQPFQQAVVRAAWGMYRTCRTVNEHVAAHE